MLMCIRKNILMVKSGDRFSEPNERARLDRIDGDGRRSPGLWTMRGLQTGMKNSGIGIKPLCCTHASQIKSCFERRCV